MNENKNPKIPIFYYYAVTLIVVMLFNIIISPLLNERKTVEIDYGTFIQRVEKG